MTRRQLPKPDKTKFYLTIVIILLLIWLSALRIDAHPGKLVAGWPQMKRLLGEMLPPDWRYFSRIIEPMLETVRMALIGTTFGSLLAIPLSLLAARNITFAPYLYYPARILLNLIRAIPDLLSAAIFVAIFGIGPLAGILALVLFTFGVVSKLTSESLEGIDQGPLEALAAVGANKWQQIHFGVVPQILPQFMAYVLYLFEVNIRAATVLGLVGAGGIGLYYNRTLGLLQYNRAASIILFTLVIVLIIDLVSIKIRERLV